MSAVHPKVIAELRALQGPRSPHFLVELIDLFLKEAESRLEELRGARTEGDGRRLERAAHTLKGSCGNLGAQAMSRICADLQAAGGKSDWVRAEELLPKLEAEFKAVKSELEAERGRS